MEFSEEQQKIKEHSKTSEKSLIIESVAGSGKTTTLLNCVLPGLLERGLHHTEIGVLMFNKAIQLEFEEKARAAGLQSQISTFHSFGLRLLSEKFGTKMDKDKLKKIGEKMRVSNYEVYKLVTLAKTEGIEVVQGRSGIKFWNHLVDEYSFDLQPREIAQAKEVFEKSIQDTKTCDFADMLYLPVYHKLKNKKIKVLCIDEAQDTGALRLEFLKVVFDNVQIFAVGDPNQCIFGFAGSDENAMQKIKEHFKAEELPLFTSWRCSRAVTRKANEIVPHMRCRPDAPEGSVSKIDEFEFDNRKLGSDTFILCRLNAPLLGVLFSLLKRGYECRIHGRDIGEEIISISKKWKWDSFSELKEKLNKYLIKQRDKLLPENRRAYAAISDKVEVLLLLIAKCQEVGRKNKDDLPFFIREIFRDTGEGVVLSTVHRLKGKEAKDVYLWGTDKHSAKWLKKDWEFREEERVKFVAITRAKENLVYVMLGDDEPQKKKNKVIDNLPRKGAGKTKADFLPIESGDDFDF